MSGLKQELGLGQGVGLLSTSLLGTGVSPSRRWRRWSLAITACGMAAAHSPCFPDCHRLRPARPPFSQRGRRGPLCRYGLWATSGQRHRLAVFIGYPGRTPRRLHIATGFGQALFGWHDAQLLLAELGTLAIVWWVGSRGASSSANLQTLVAVLIVALIVVVWWRGGISPAQIPFPAPAEIDRGQLFLALSVMFWCFVGLEAFAHLASEFKHPERDFPRALMIGLLLAGSVYWACTVLVLHFHAFGEEMAAAASLPNIVVRLFGVEALWVACVIGYLACFASLNIYIQSFARLVWSQAQHKPHSYLARLSPRQIPRNALNAVLGSCVVSTLGIYLLDINLDALIVYANGIFIMIYLLCMLAGCRLLRGRYRLLAVVGSILCLLLLAMVGWKSLYALVMLAGLWLFLPRRKLATGSV
ncbi:permease [Klebsiella pneumoniae]|uniref:Permease n=1 Tax=Klebsiella pneumoniae TaxID=573 RepID=A0A2X3CX65_KLEPN|nr:permease [Klebsiella pneumoniae]